MGTALHQAHIAGTSSEAVFRAAVCQAMVFKARCVRPQSVSHGVSGRGLSKLYNLVHIA